MLLPVTFNGIGTSQVAFVSFFARAHVLAAPALALSVLFVALGIVGNLPGGLLYAVGRRGDTERARGTEGFGHRDTETQRKPNSTKSA
jgi:hypothetical protein